MQEKVSFITTEDVEKENVDALIIAVGSTPIVPLIEGVDLEHVNVVNHYYQYKKELHDEVIVIGGGLAGCECAVDLLRNGKKVHLVEMQDELARDANIRHRPLLLQEIEKGIDVHTGLKANHIAKEGIYCLNQDNEEIFISGNDVILAIGQRSNKNVVEELRNCAPFVRVVGYARQVRSITQAMYEGYPIAKDI